MIPQGASTDLGRPKRTKFISREFIWVNILINELSWIAMIIWLISLHGAKGLKVSQPEDESFPDEKKKTGISNDERAGRSTIIEGSL